MRIEEFRTAVAEYITENKGGDYTLELNDVVKNNGVILHGITFKRPGKNVAPTLYMENYYECDTYELTEIAERVIRDEKKSWDGEDFDCEFFSDFEKVRDRLFVKLINTGKNMNLLNEVPNRYFLDLSMVVYCNVEDLCNMKASILIRNDHLSCWKIDEDEFIDIAYENTRRAGAKIKDIVDFFDMGFGDGEIETIRALTPERGHMYVMTNEQATFGAVCMTFDDMLDEFCEKVSSGFYIIPSSIHEVLLIPSTDSDTQAESLGSIIGIVNEETLSTEEVLSDHAYYYSPEAGYISV